MMLVPLRHFLLLLWVCSMITPVFAWSNLSDKIGRGKSSPVVRWNKLPIRIAFSESLFKDNQNIKKGSDVESALKRSFAIWESATNVRFEFDRTDTSNVSPAGEFGDGVSLITSVASAENMLFFGKHIMETPAATRVFYDSAGNITEADIVLNPLHQFTTDGTFGTYDLESVLIHEIGHLLGIDHTSAIGAVMHDVIPKNGLFGLSHSTAGGLTHVDLTLARSLYGQMADDEDCCGSLDVMLSIPRRKNGPGGLVWIEEKNSGQVYALSESDNSKNFKLSGIPSGTYIVYWQGSFGVNTKTADQIVGEVLIRSGKTTLLKKSLTLQEIKHEVQLVGLNGELASSPVKLTPGKTHTIYIGGLNLAADKVRIRAASRFLEVDDLTVNSLDYGDLISVMSVQINVDETTPEGLFSIYVEDSRGNQSNLIAAIRIDNN